jgi:uncharacterized protein (DUF1684 family)
MKVKTMNEKTKYSNKGWARKAMTVLLDKRVPFETIYEYAGYDEYRIGLKYTDKNGSQRLVWPMDEMLFDVIRTSI